jgi:hypothetical protein
MDLSAFRATLADAEPPRRLTPALRALWHDAKGDWNAAHKQVMAAEGTAEADLVHAYLHRKEGDAGNAGHWYRQAGAEPFEGSLEEEWEATVTRLLVDLAPD